MFDCWGRMIYRRRRLVLVLSLLAVTFAGAWGTGVFGSLQTAGGFNAPGSQSQHASDLAAAAFGRGHRGRRRAVQERADDRRGSAYREAVTSTLRALPASRVDSAATFWSTGSRQFASASGRETYAVLALAGGTDSRQDQELRRDLGKRSPCLA